MLSWEPHYWPDADLLFYAHLVSAAQMGWGGTGWVAWEVPPTPFPSPSAAPTTCHMLHGSDPSSPLTEAHLPSSPSEQQRELACHLC